MRFEDQVAIVTGAGQGIGKGIAEIFATEGAKVIGCDINTATLEKTSQEINAKGGVYVPVKVDVTKENEVQNMVAQVINDHSRIDILVNNVGGVIGQDKLLSEISDDLWARTFDLNLTSQFVSCKAVFPHMRDRGYGRIVNMSSLVGVRPKISDALPYVAAKGCVLGLTRQMAFEFAPHGVTINAIAHTDTITERLHEQIEEGSWPETVDELRARHAKYPVGRPAEVNDVAKAVAFLASREANYIVGETMIVSGGNFMGV